MKIRKPHYFDSFRCLASACPDSCCKEWDVDVDPQATAAYQALPGELGDRLRQVLRGGEDGWATMTIVDGRCPMWRADGLCQIQAQLGHDALCATCREFPRLTHDYGAFIEYGLELSCPEAARLILADSHPQWITEEIPGETPSISPALALLLESRQAAVSILLDPRFEVGQALAPLLLYGYAVQEALDWDEPVSFDPVQALTEVRSLAQPGDLAAILDLYKELEILTPQWRAMLDQPPCNAPWTPQHRALARYFIDRYWLQALSDRDLVGRVKFILTSCLVVRALGGDLAQTAQLYSKEIENDADNVNTLLDAAYTAPALADVQLLGLLLS